MNFLKLALIVLIAITASLHAEPFHEKNTSIDFPEKLGDFKRSSEGSYFADGYENVTIAYSANSCTATIYIYKRIQSDIEDGFHSNVAKFYLDDAINGIKEVERLGHYKNLKIYRGGVKKLGTSDDFYGYQWESAAFSFNTETGAVISSLYVTTYKGWLLKIRATSGDLENKNLVKISELVSELLDDSKKPAEQLSDVI